MIPSLLVLLLTACDDAALDADFTDAEVADLDHDPAGLPDDQAPPPPVLTMAGACPGPVLFGVTSATPGGTVRFVWGSPGAATAVPSGPCAGTQIQVLAPAMYSAPFTASGTGTLTVPATLPPTACGKLAYPVDIASCTVGAPILL